MRILVAYRGITLPDGSQAPGWATGDSVIRALRKIGHDAQPYGWFYRTRMPLAPVPLDDPDLLICMECGDEDPQYYQLDALTCPKIYWEFDTALHAQWTSQWLQTMRFQKVFMGNPTWAQNFGVNYLPYAIDEEHFYPLRPPQGGKGSVMPEKLRLSRVAIIGSPFQERILFSKAAGVELISNMFAENYAKAVRELDIHVHHHSSGGQGLLVMRIWETMASKTLLMVPASDETMGLHFANWVHYVSYTDASDCREKIQWLKNHPDRMVAIRQAGYDEVMEKHTYAHRIVQMVGEEMAA